MKKTTNVKYIEKDIEHIFKSNSTSNISQDKPETAKVQAEVNKIFEDIYNLCWAQINIKNVKKWVDESFGGTIIRSIYYKNGTIEHYRFNYDDGKKILIPISDEDYNFLENAARNNAPNRSPYDPRRKRYYIYDESSIHPENYSSGIT